MHACNAATASPALGGAPQAAYNWQCSVLTIL
jgi:hypothetical protein